MTAVASRTREFVGRRLTAAKGALGFLTRIPTGRSESAWTAFSETPAAFPLAGWVVGALAATPFLAAALVPVPAPTVAFGYLLALYAVTGINHADGVADLGDAAAVHGDPEARRAVLKDTEVGVGAVLALGLVVVGLALAALALARLPLAAAVTVVVAAEVGAKFGMAALACLGDPAFEGLGSAFTDNAPVALVAPAAVAAPVVGLGRFVTPLAAVGFPAVTLGASAAGLVAASTAALAGAVAVALALLRWSRANLGGVNGDVFGAANELARIAGLHLGVVAWTLS
ncbi:adenosylcobinamide-GDP ribazoletransferase [Halorussus aquaticus]|uniref:Adenosylcobinamide-GDP ribazoletransferase n=1 Tax=Halorussus aquaticus TaxID=2953748 RepID=A0ABD5Q173_9EURY|nr:adenosylcobinamide-GDP ribazoletransferase [Halorussus aquaticus]